MKLKDVAEFLRNYGVGEYQVSVLDYEEVIIRPFDDEEIVVTPSMIMKMIAAKDAQKAHDDL
ncbi:hypothetical protein PU345_002125 [Enterobacter kobei]|nr:hypothetical protein [Enterobacter kobei]